MASRSSLAALVAAVLLVPSLVAQPTVQVAARAGGGSVLLVDDNGTPVVVRETTAEISAARGLVFPNTPELLVLWNEDSEGLQVPWYAASIDHGASFAVVAPAATELLLRYGSFDPLVAVPGVPPHLDANLGGRLWIVQFHAQTLQGFRDAITGVGGTIHLYMPHDAYVVEMDAKTAARVQAFPFVRWVGSFHPAYKLDETLLFDQAQGFSATPVRRVNILTCRRGLAGQEPVAAVVQPRGGKVELLDPDTFLMSATVDFATIAELARLDAVQWIDLWSAPENDMDIARQFHGAIYVDTLGFDGSGVRGEVLDGGTEVTHPDFQSPPPISHGAVPAGNHGTCTYGQVFADPSAGIGTGILYNGQGIAGYYSAFSGGTRFAHTQQLVDPLGTYQAVFQSNSWGDALTTAYNSVSQSMDDIIFQLDFTILNSQSNNNTQQSRPQAWAKNIISVGGINHLGTLSEADDNWGGASIGPAADGRLKPDIASFYDGIYTTDQVGAAGYASGNYYSSFGGTSGATPISAGMTGLFYQMWHQGVFGNPTSTSVFLSRPHATLAKAFMINTARQWAFSGTAANLTRTHQGWGRPDAQKMYDARTKIAYENEGVRLQNLQSQLYSYNVAVGEPEFQATLTWADLPGTTSATQHRINNLDLRVTSPTGTVYWGNNGLAAGTTSTSGGSPNTVDTVENVIIANPTAGVWTVEIIAAQLNQDGVVETPGVVDADYALVVRGVVQVPSFQLEFSTTAGTGSLHLGVANIPAGTGQGFCLFSNLTTGAKGGGSVFGLYPDLFLFATLTQPLFAGNPFHWTWPEGAAFPATPIDLGPGSIVFPSGSKTDGVAIALSPTGAFIRATPVTRVTW